MWNIFHGKQWLCITKLEALPPRQTSCEAIILLCQDGASGSPDGQLPATRPCAVGLSKYVLFSAECIVKIQTLPFFVVLACRLLAALYLLQFCCLGKEFRRVCMPRWAGDRVMIRSNSKCFFSVLQSCFIGTMLENEIDVWIHCGSSELIRRS